MGLSRTELLKKIAESDVTSGGNNLRDGRYRLVARKFEITEGFKGTRAVFEFVVMTSAKKPVTQLTGPKAGQAIDVEPNPPGSDVSFVNMLDKHESAFGNVKAVILALAGVDDASQEDIIETMEAMERGEEGIGRMIDCDTYRKVTKLNGVEIVLPKWTPVEQTDEQIEKTRMWLESLQGVAAAGAA